MFNMGFTEIILLGTIALIFIGPKQLPELARTLARMMNEFKRATSGVTDSFDDIKKEAQGLKNTAEQRVQRELEGVTSGVEEIKDSIKSSEEKPAEPEALENKKNQGEE